MVPEQHDAYFNLVTEYKARAKAVSTFLHETNSYDILSCSVGSIKTLINNNELDFVILFDFGLFSPERQNIIFANKHQIYSIFHIF